tara:strand:- start:30 stop:269 length:240 start_codon:yes stop_codon:yes gene_type:complete
LKIFWPFNSLLIKQDKESNSKGEQSNNIFITSIKLFELNNKLVKYEPRKRLPESPINTFEGYQFNKINPDNAPIRGIKL